MYLRHLVHLARKALGPDAMLFTTDPPQVTEIGSLRGEEVLTCAPHLDQGLGLDRQCCSLRGEEVLRARPALAAAWAVSTLNPET